MKRFAVGILLTAALQMPIPAYAAETAPGSAEGTIFTIWPLIDYRESPKEGFSNLGLLGPLIKIQKQGNERVFSVRPLFYSSSNEKQETSETDFLYPLASYETAPEGSHFQFLKLIQSSIRKVEKEGYTSESMFFPFYISGRSEKYGPYTSLFPIYGDIYERFWRDEYHFFLFPLYGSTVRKGTTSRNYLWPFFNSVSGENASGFAFWPLYGQAAIEGVYHRQYALWPLYIHNVAGLDTENPIDRLIMFPLYSSTDSPDKTARGYLWPLLGYSEDRKRKEIERDFLWPLWWTVRGESRQVDSFLPFYFNEKSKESTKNWYLWPLYRNDTIASDTFSRERDTLLYFLYSDTLEHWAKDSSDRRRTALWPLFIYKKDNNGVRSLSMPAPVEPILDREQIDKNWAPLWRLYQHKWNDCGESALSLFWNLYWHDSRKEALAYEMFPLISYTGTADVSSVSFIKGLIRYRNEAGGKSLNLLWLPFGFSWGEKMPQSITSERKAGVGL